MPGDGIEIEIGEIQSRFATVGNTFARQIAVQIHLPKADGVRSGIARRHRRYRTDIAHFGHRGQTAHRDLDRAGEIRRVHGVGDIQRAEVAGDILADAGVIQVFVKGRRRVNLQDLRAQVAHIDAPGNRVRAINRVFKHDVRIAGFKLNFRQPLEQIAGADPALADPLVGHQLRIHFAHRDIAERFTVQALDVVGREQRHLRIFFR